MELRYWTPFEDPELSAHAPWNGLMIAFTRSSRFLMSSRVLLRDQRISGLPFRFVSLIC